ncbi:uncharacterized protein [Palaemon carinicauda]|uniref:uncharacterized protein n=1 Tax=Palaemon carinicauda TaxID=392227 RepID=UPI0035B58C98
MANKMKCDIDRQDLKDNLLSIMYKQNCVMQQMCDQLIDMKREISSISNSALVTYTPFNSNRVNTSDINPFITVDREDIMKSHNNSASLVTHNLSNNTQPIVPSNPFQGSNTGTNSLIPVGNLNNSIDNHFKKFILKPKDIVMLKLSELQGIGTENRIARFFSLVELCASADIDRIQVVLARVEQEIATLLTAEMGKMGNNISWSQFKDILNQFKDTQNHHFACSANILQAWQEIELEHYSIDEDPRAFVDRMKCKVAALERKFPKNSLPKADSLLKRKLYSRLNSISQKRIKDFLDDRIPLERFIELVEYEHHLATISDATQY